MKKIVIVFLVLMLVLTACSLPRLVKVEDQPEPTATKVVVITQEPEPPAADPIATDIIDLDVTKNILMSEDFSVDVGTWNTGVWEGNAGEDYISDGEYWVIVKEENYMLSSQAFHTGTPDAVMEVETRLHSGSEENGQGFVCRYTDQDNFYFLHIGNDGYYAIEKYVDNVYETLASDFDTDVIDPTQNLVRAECNGNKLRLWANGKLLAEVEDDSLVDGAVALYTRSWDEGNITIAYDNFMIYDPNPNFFGQGVSDDSPIERVLFSDDFESGPGNWQVGNYNQADLEISSGWLTYTMKEPNREVWDVTREVDAGDVRMEAYFSNDAAQTENIQGFICRFQDNDNFYRISFGNDGYLRVGKVVDGTWTSFVDEYESSGAIDPNFNRVEASCEGNTLRLWIYGVLVVEASDPENTFDSGDVGFIVGTFDDPNVVVSINDFVVISLD